MSEKHALRRAFLYATFAYERLRVGIRERLFRFGVCFLYAVGPGRAVCHGAARWSMFSVCSGTGRAVCHGAARWSMFPVCSGTGVKPVFVL